MIKTEYMNMPGFVPTERELFSRYWSRRHPCCSCPQRSIFSSEMAHTSFLITLAQTNTAMRTANPPTLNASTESGYLFKRKLFLRRPFMGLFSYLWPLGRKDAFKTSVTVCRGDTIHAINVVHAPDYLSSPTKCIRENNLFVFNSF